MFLDASKTAEQNRGASRPSVRSAGSTICKANVFEAVSRPQFTWPRPSRYPVAGFNYSARSGRTSCDGNSCVADGLRLHVPRTTGPGYGRLRRSYAGLFSRPRRVPRQELRHRGSLLVDSRGRSGKHHLSICHSLLLPTLRPPQPRRAHLWVPSKPARRCRLEFMPSAVSTTGPSAFNS
jgi:hypothetical protein